MFEHRREPLLSKRAFAARVARCAALGLGVVVFALGVGILGYHGFEKMPWVDALANAAMILGGMGPVDPLHTTGGKVFAAIYALFSGLVFLVVMAVVLAPIVHRFLHRFHLELSEGASENGPGGDD